MARGWWWYPWLDVFVYIFPVGYIYIIIYRNIRSGGLEEVGPFVTVE